MNNPLLELEQALADIRLSPEPLDERTEELKQQWETVLSLMEAAFLGALMSGDWTEFDEFVNDFKQCTSTQTMTTEVVEDEFHPRI